MSNGELLALIYLYSLRQKSIKMKINFHCHTKSPQDITLKVRIPAKSTSPTRSCVRRLETKAKTKKEKSKRKNKKHRRKFEIRVNFLRCESI